MYGPKEAGLNHDPKYATMLYNYTCKSKKCGGWWTVTADIGWKPYFINKEWHCPWCGHVGKHGNNYKKYDNNYEPYG